MRLRLMILPVLGLALAAISHTSEPGPTISAASGIVMDADTGKVLWAKDADTMRYPASTTKVMTALLLVENTKPTDILTAPPDVETITGASLYLKPGEQVTAREMLFALMLRSANDGCYTVAKHVSGSVEEFAKLMNKRAVELGCKNTNFTNPHGLNDDNHMTCARDLAIIAREALKHPQFAEAVGTRLHWVKRSINQEDLLLISKNKLLKSDKTIDGVKTGWTVPAGHCFVGSATRDGYKLISVVMKSEDWATDTETLFNWAFKTHERVRLFENGVSFGRQKVDNGSVGDVPLLGSREVWTVVRKGATRDAKVSVDGAAKPVSAPIVTGSPIAKGLVIDSEGFGQRLDLLAGSAVAVRPPLVRAFFSPTGIVVGVALLLGIVAYRRRSRVF